MQLGKDSCCCGHVIDHHDGRGGPCNYCACSAGEPPNGYQVGVIHSLHEITMTLMRLVKELQAQKGGQGG